MANTSRSRTGRRSASTARSSAARSSAPRGKGKSKGRGDSAGKPGASPAGRKKPAAARTRRPAGAGGGRSGARNAKRRTAARTAGPSLRTLVFGSVAAALIVAGAALGVSLDEMLRAEEAAPPPAAATAPGATAAAAATAAPPAPDAAPAPDSPPSPAATAPEPVSPPAVLRASEAQDYARAEAEYREVPPWRPGGGDADAGEGAATPAAPAPTVKPPAPEAAAGRQVAALPLTAPRVLAPARRSYDGEAPWLRNAVAAPPTEGRPMIAVVIDDLGVDKRRSAQLVKLPGPLTTAWMTYADNVADQARAAREAGHELIIHMPMEPLNASIDGGPDVLRTSMTADEVRARVREGLAKFDGYVGVNNHMGSKFTADPAGMAVVIDEMRANGLLFLDSRTSPRSVAAELAEKAGIPHAVRDVFIDNVDEVGAVLKQLGKVERVARRTGYAIAIGHPHDGTIQALKQWLPTLRDKGLVLVPLSAVVRDRMGQG